ncbi:hypothetical protein EI94DRAFT_1731397 [Lactarius quietus]|nr:hypothetical protein EI94DRAFT_1731397 [Lactarius quietus]
MTDRMTATPTTVSAAMGEVALIESGLGNVDLSENDVRTRRGIRSTTTLRRFICIELHNNDNSMDGATNMNVSNAPPVITAGEAKKLKKTIAKDAAAAEKHVAQVSKALRSAEKDEGKAEKAAHTAQRTREKAVQEEHKLAQALGEAQHKHDLAVADENKAANDLSMRQKHLQEVHQTVETWRAELRQAQQQRDTGAVDRQERLQQARQVADTGRAAGPTVS